METPIFAYDKNIRPIDHIDFDILGNEEIKGRSALGRNTHGIEFADLMENGEPKLNGLADPRLGTVDNSTICATCEFNNNYCPGHTGHMDLVEAFFHIGFIDHHVKKILECICLNCSRILIHRNEAKIEDILKTKVGKARLVEVANISKNITYCQYCGTHVSKIKVDIKKSTTTINVTSEIDLQNIKDESVLSDNKGKTKLIQQLTPDIVYEKLKNISDDDCRIIGLKPERTRPEYMIHKTLLIPPMSIRPAARVDFNSGGSAEDGLTHRLVDITKFNYKLQKQKETGNYTFSKYSKDQSTLLQYHIAAYFDKDLISTPKGDNDKYRSIAPGIKAKEGRIRGNLMGKRVNFTGRTVITSDPVINNNQIRVPLKMAKNLTFPEVVTSTNKEKLQELVRRGRDEYPGANFVFPVSNMVEGQTVWPIDLRFSKEQVELHEGDIVERHMITGDPVIVNRQPSLHKQSMMCHEAVIVNDESIMSLGLSVAVTKPYNADFDGDEMNIFLPQSLQTQIELEEIANVKRQIISPSTSRTSIGLVQDGLLGAYNLTSPTVRIDWRNAANIISYTSFENMKKLHKNRDYTGQELFSLIIPPGINLSTSTVKVKDSVLQEGSRLSKDVLGEKKDYALHQFVWDEYGADETRKFIDNAQKLINNFNLYQGFTVGYGDAKIDQSVKDDIDKLFMTRQKKIEHVITQYENNPEMMDRDVFEFKLLQESGVLTDVKNLIMANLKPDNNFNIMVSSGSKGNDINIGQVMGSLGLQAIEGKLAPKKYNSRTLAYFHQNDDRYASRGVVRESYMDGLTFPSFTYLLMAGREGIIDQAIKTADTGYAQRRLIKSMEDHMIKYDCTVRTANEGLIQLVYGDSGSDTTKQYDYNIDSAKMSDAELKTKFYIDDSSFSKNDEVFNIIKKMRDQFRESMIKAKNEFRALSTKIKFPVNFNRIIDKVANDKTLQTGNIVKPDYVYEILEKILQNKYTRLLPMTKEEQNNDKSIKNHDEAIFKSNLKYALYNALAPKRCIDRKLTQTQFDKIIADIVATYNRSIVQPGEMVGVLSAHSLGETITQMNLNTFHSAGIKTMSSTIFGIPRIKEILGVSKNIRTPRLTIFLEDKYKKNKDMAKRIKSNLKYTILGDIRGRINVYYDPNPEVGTGLMKEDNIKNAYYTQKTISNKVACQSEFKSLPWLIRIEILKEKMLEKEISLLDIKSKFCNWWEKRYIDSKLLKKEEKRVINKITNLSVLSNTDNDKQPVIHIRFNVKDADKVRDPFNRDMLNEFIDVIIDNFKIKGIESITGIHDVVSEKLMQIDPETKEIKNEEEFVIYTQGTNLIDIRYITGINLAKTISNDIVDVYKNFGIEIARSRLLRELFDAYELQGNAVSYTNLSILIDTMCINGSLMSIDRHGMGKSDTDVLGRASFERAVEQILTASVFGETDHMKGVSSRIMGGLVIKGGTGFCDIILDTNQIEKSEYNDSANIYRAHTDIRVDDIANDIISHDVENMFIPM